ncbi:sensor histidine kinase [Microbacterium sp. P04]|uniref:sensor histidine kinase n=1 Tax=Microbacterium sp. P04 TaxID=3366947 RepID=UPI0037457A09
MTPPAADANAVSASVGNRALARGVTATWWYTFSGVVVFGAVSFLPWIAWLLARFSDSEGTAWRVPAGLAGVVLALVGVAALLRDYRANVLAAREGEPRRWQPGDLVGFGAMIVAAVLLGVATASWLAAASILSYALSVRAWPHGIRWRVIVALTAVIVALWIVEAPAWAGVTDTRDVVLVPAVFAVLLPLTCASSLWWWDIVVELDRARDAESALSATRERLRLANDVHDLQGHHLQVIALQLELAERLLQRDDSEGAARELTRARAAVDDARQGTRDLATRFRGVPLPDELDNAADLLRSAGLEVHARVDPGIADAPVDVLGPIVRESVTNVLKHGGGKRVDLSLGRVADRWVYRIANDDPAGDEIERGSGLEGMAERAEAVGGEVTVLREGTSFALTVSLPTEGMPA